MGGWLVGGGAYAHNSILLTNKNLPHWQLLAWLRVGEGRSLFLVNASNGLSIDPPLAASLILMTLLPRMGGCLATARPLPDHHDPCHRLLPTPLSTSSNCLDSHIVSKGHSPLSSAVDTWRWTDLRTIAVSIRSIWGRQ